MGFDSRYEAGEDSAVAKCIQDWELTTIPAKGS
jgi:hypothetical protein